MESFNFQNQKITNFEMETSALYYLGQTLGHNTLTICAIIANRLSKQYSKDYKQTVEKMIDLVLNKIC
jgi:uridine phosphorylase